MCSIVGFYNKTTEQLDSQTFFDQSFDLMQSRGPDHQAFQEIDALCSFGHQRLSIIDVDDEANQPMTYGSFTIVFNGEIYNYLELKDELTKEHISFETQSDTEVLLRGYVQHGIAFFNKLNGMFAFAIYNNETKELILVRDRFGVKPLHYMMQDGIYYFSSEIKPLIEIKKDKKLNINVYQNFFDHMATDYNEETFIEEIYQVRSGHYVRIKNESKESRWYYGNDFIFDESIFKDKGKTLQFVEDTLVSAIDYRMRADVPICMTLSGGIDSTTIYTLIKERLRRDIKLFTFIHPDSPTNEYDKVQKLCAGYDDIVCTVQSEHTNTFKDVEDDLNVVEFPIWGISTRAYVDMYNSIHQGGFKVVIEGHGSDEQLGGYPYMIESAFYDYLAQGSLVKAYEILKLVQETGHSGLGNRSRTLLKTYIKSIIRFFLKKNEIKYFQENIDWTVEFKILPIVLRAFDRLSMGASIESRSPFMDYRIVELFKKLPLEFKINSIGNKSILRDILKKYNKTYIYEDKEKMGFASDIPRFFNTPENKKMARTYIENFTMNEFDKQKKKALEEISKDRIEWSSVFEMSKVIMISMINQKYGLTHG